MTILEAIFFSALGVFCLFAFSYNLLFWYESLNTPEPKIPQPRPGLFFCATRYGKTLIFATLCTGLSLSGPFLRHLINSRQKSASGLPPVVLIHGLYNNAGCWMYLARKLQQAGYPVSAFVYRSLCNTPEQIAERLDCHIRALEQSPAVPRPILVCHSLGGLISRFWLTKEANQQRIQGLITLASPHGGSKLAALGPGRLAKNIIPGSIFLQTLRDAPAIATFCSALAGPDDDTVLPPSALLPPKNWRFRLTPAAGHFGMLFHPVVADMLLQELECARMRSSSESTERLTDRRFFTNGQS